MVLVQGLFLHYNRYTRKVKMKYCSEEKNDLFQLTLDILAILQKYFSNGSKEHS